MTLDELRNYCLAFPGVEECLPFDDSTLVFKVGNKIFALLDLNTFQSINLKCNPEKLIEFREVYHAVSPGYHMNKKHWMTVSFGKDVNDSLVFEWITTSYSLVFAKLQKRIKDEITLG
jgi:predicted DNA-binding protein (MmcQ/YjbR family)